MRKNSNGRANVLKARRALRAEPRAPRVPALGTLAEDRMKTSSQLTKVREGVFITESQVCKLGSGKSVLRPS